MNKQALEQSVRYADANAKSVLSHRLPSKALIADLSEESFYEFDIPQAYLEKYAGGPALGTRLWADFAGYSVDDPACLESENPIVAIPSVSGTEQTCIVFCSPATGNLAFNNFFSSLSVAPYTALVIVGRLKKKGVVKYESGTCSFEYTDSLSDKNTSEINSVYPNCIACGRAGDNAVTFATCIHNNHTTGRGGLGYVFAAKNIKALVLEKEEKESSVRINDNKLIQLANRYGWAPVSNFSLRYDPRLFYLCPVKSPSSIPYDARLMLGSNCNTFDISKVQKRYEFCIENSLDPVSAGNILGAYITQNKETDFKDNTKVMHLLEMLVKNADIYAGLEDELYEINGLECGPYDYRGCFAQSLSDGLGNCFPVFFALKRTGFSKDFAKLVSFNEMLVYGLQSLGISENVIFSLLDSKPNLKRISYAITHTIKSTVPFRSILKVGENCRSLIRRVNAHLKILMPSVPDYFCIEPECNYSDKTVVPFRTLLNNYSNICNEEEYGKNN